MLESLISHSGIRDINATTQRLVERCLSGEWCVQLRKLSSPGCSDSSVSSLGGGNAASGITTPTIKMTFDRGASGSPGAESAVTSASAPPRSGSHTTSGVGASAGITSSRSPKLPALKTSKSMETLVRPPPVRGKTLVGVVMAGLSVDRPHNESSLSLVDVAASSHTKKTPPRAGSLPMTSPDTTVSATMLPSSVSVPDTRTDPRVAGPSSRAAYDTGSLGHAVDSIVISETGTSRSRPPPVPPSPPVPHQSSGKSAGENGKKTRRSAPTPPPKARRPAPQIPTRAQGTSVSIGGRSRGISSGSVQYMTASGAKLTAIATSTGQPPSPLSRVAVSSVIP